jgi:anti-sigma regulatory factor (Ser/Thr protein kinase)
MTPATVSNPLEMAALPTAPGCARQHAVMMVTEWGLGHLSELAELIVSELMSNAVKAAVADAPAGMLPVVCYQLARTADRVRVEVWDGSPNLPVMREATLDDECGRGLLLVNELTEGHWGWFRAHGGGKVVWAEMRRLVADLPPPHTTRTSSRAAP